ncbi:alpha-E domain-containing protein [Leptospira kmetyi]|uniref:Alpha-E domain-containing protein n=1 Tax=Leptospira kmetyi TaxID=408139 RepID=A0A2M9XV30_9LEPT|nr:alpha-E domain-containing protein [Leptospira kmetyi]AYV57142.1 alpha-E domain-containing protein [Leptospira kmetyi]PJZ31862.1 alpha-E domain-containing protein [Leptospira kmetyi]PJZ43190.1 alpha-E domain-containing protein [Leptospira kmetyi]TGK21494.1 alpha-E domain-containing protein [Leptospira kmetyi]TGK28421.1 alpha-E domain-containing protein [Leptospira kmetyi]
MLSRVAESVYWMNRYMERAENYSRFIDVNFQLSLDLNEDVNRQWMPLVFTTGDNELFQKKYSEPSKENVIHFMTFDTENPNSILNCLIRSRENARTIRENISTPMWEVMNEFYLTFKSKKHFTDTDLSVLSEFFKSIRNQCLLFYGCQEATIARDEVWYFAQLGRYLERADKTARILDMKYFILLPSHDVGSNLDLIQWLSLLKSTSAHEMFNRIYQKITPKNIAEFLILDRQFPRAVRFSLRKIFDSLKVLSGTDPDEYSCEAEKRVGVLLSELSYTSVEEIFNSGMHEYLDKLQLQINGIHDRIDERYFRF